VNTERRTDSHSKTTHERQEGTKPPVVITTKEQLASVVYTAGDTSRFEQPSLVTPAGTDIEWNDTPEEPPKREVSLFIRALGEREVLVWREERRKEAVEMWRKENPQKYRDYMRD
jgi:hypothetical protein